MADEEAAALHLALLAVPGIGLATADQLVAAFGGIRPLAAGHPPASGWDAAAGALDRRLTKALAGGVTAHGAAVGGPPWRSPLVRSLAAALPAARAAVKRARSLGLTVLCREDHAYPTALTTLPHDVPAVLFVAGQLPAECLAPPSELASVAVVGARAASQYSLSFARDLAADLAASGLVVVSGLALGTDAAAHEGALAAGVTVAVLGGGHARLHPRSHSGLADRIVRGGGAVISEWPPDTNPHPGHFPWRNRVVSGLSRVVAVIEAGQRSGAMSTVEHALAQGRSVLAVPDRPDSRRAAGNLSLLRDGATPLIDVEDVLALFPERNVEHRQSPAVPRPAVGDAAGALHRRLLAELAGGGWHVAEALAGRLAAAPQELLAALTDLELAGEVEHDAGSYRRTTRRR